MKQRATVSPDLAQAVVAIAREAGCAIQAIYDDVGRFARSEVAKKVDDSPLTHADLAAHRIILAGLAELTPDIPVVSEEAEDCSAAQVGRFWLVDPLDGTKEFLSRNGEFTVNIALVEEGIAVFGVVHAPVLDRLYWGGRGLGAWRQSCDALEPIGVAALPGTGCPVRVVASKSHLNSETTDFIERLGHCQSLAIGSSLKLCLVAEGAADVYPRLGPTRGWDTAAAHAIVEAAGGHVIALGGEPLHYRRPAELNPHFVVSGRPLADLLGRE